MTIELTEQRCRVVQEQGGRPVEVLDPSTARAYVLIAREQYERVRSLLQDEQPGTPALPVVPPGIRKSQEALRRDLPQFLNQKRVVGQWVGYHGDEQIGIARDKAVLIRTCLQRGWRDDSYYIGLIDPTELIEEEELEDPKAEHFDAEWAESTRESPTS